MEFRVPNACRGRHRLDIYCPPRWDGDQWLEAAEEVSAVAATAAFDGHIRRSVQAHRTTGEDRFMRQWQEFGNYYAFGALAAFDAWGEIDGDLRAKNVAMDVREVS